MYNILVLYIGAKASTIGSPSSPQPAGGNRSHQRNTPLSFRLDLTSIPESDISFILERLPSPNVLRTNHKLFHYRSGSGDCELLICVGGSPVQSNQNQSTSQSEIQSKRDGRAFDFLDLTRPLNGWISVQYTIESFCPPEVPSGSNMFTLTGDLILAFGIRSSNAPVYAIDLRYLIEQYTQQSLQIAEAALAWPEPDLRAQHSIDARPQVLCLEGARLWRPVALNNNSASAYNFYDKLIVSTPLSL